MLLASGYTFVRFLATPQERSKEYDIVVSSLEQYLNQAERTCALRNWLDEEALIEETHEEFMSYLETEPVKKTVSWATQLTDVKEYAPEPDPALDFDSACQKFIDSVHKIQANAVKENRVEKLDSALCLGLMLSASNTVPAPEPAPEPEIIFGSFGLRDDTDTDTDTDTWEEKDLLTIFSLNLHHSLVGQSVSHNLT